MNSVCIIIHTELGFVEKKARIIEFIITKSSVSFDKGFYLQLFHS